METLLLTLDTIALMVVLYFSFKGEKTPGSPDLGPFRLRVPEAVQSKSANQPVAHTARRR